MHAGLLFLQDAPREPLLRDEARDEVEQQPRRSDQVRQKDGMRGEDATLDAVRPNESADHQIPREDVRPATLEYFPAKHSMHAPAELEPPVTSLYRPFMQSIHAEAAVEPLAVTYLPIAQAIQSDAALEPMAATYLPAKHAMQSEASSEPVTATYFPAPHWMQSDAASEPVAATYRPATHPMHADAWAPLYFPAAHAMHEVAKPAVSLVLRFVPAAQLLQKPCPSVS